MTIGVLRGDDIDLEAVPETVKVMKAAAAKTRLSIEWQDFQPASAATPHAGGKVQPASIRATT